MLNPMAALITMYREVLIKGLPPDWNQLMLVEPFFNIGNAVGSMAFSTF
jgi:ABC-type polysaccharide/polyol phosphate export permease